LVISVDVQPIGPNESKIGLASMNGAFREALGTTEGYNELWYDISELAGLIPFAIAGGFALVGLCQTIKRKSLLKVDSHLFVLAGFYAALLSVYVEFELIQINFRPVLMDGELEASYPSSHTMLSLGICITAMLALRELLKGKKVILIIADVFFGAVALVVLLGRLLSGVHWLSDIIAGIILISTLICLYRFFVLFVQNKKAKKENA
jgi:undecaprenyl-diphosphatase